MTLHDPARVRAWAKAQGLPVGDRGRLKPEVIAAFEQANVKPVKQKITTGPKPRKKPTHAPRTIAARPRAEARSSFTVKARQLT